MIIQLLCKMSYLRRAYYTLVCFTLLSAPSVGSRQGLCLFCLFLGIFCFMFLLLYPASRDSLALDPFLSLLSLAKIK